MSWSQRSSFSRKTFVVTLFAICISGCAHSVVHDEKRDQQAQEMQKAVTEAHLETSVASLQKAFADVAARQEQAARQLQNDLFDLEVRGIARAKSLDSKFNDTEGVDGLITVVSARLEELGLPAPVDAQLKAVRIQAAQVVAKADALRTTFAEIRGTIGHRFVSCAEVYAASADPAQKSNKPSPRFLAGFAADKRELATSKFDAAITDCVAADGAVTKQSAPYSSGTGVVSALLGQAKHLDAQIAAYESAKSQARKDVDAAAAAFKKEQEQAEAGSDKSNLESLESRAKRLRESLATIGASGAAAGQVVAEEKLRRLDALLAALAGSPQEGKVALTKDQKVSVAMVRSLPELKDEADKLLTEAAKPRLVPFLAAVNHQELVLRGYEVGQAAQRKQAQAVHNQLQAALEEGLALARVLDRLTKDASWASRSIADLEKNLGGKDKSGLHRALAIYADDVRRFRMDAAVWAVRERAAIYEEGLAQSTAIAAQWDNLMDTTAKVLVDYHASGIKQADIAEFFKALGLVAIGVGAAQ